VKAIFAANSEVADGPVAVDRGPRRAYAAAALGDGVVRTR